jgi:methylated-DNA-[protein]-cysteine S-methyltransferase
LLLGMMRTMTPRPIYQAKFVAPFGVLGIRCEADALTRIEFLAPGTAPQAPDSELAQSACKQLAAYFADPDFRFDLPLTFGGTAHQNAVWQAMCAIPRGQTRQYGELARQFGSSPRAVGQACGNNPLPIIIPCHRVVSKSGVGGFNHRSGGYALDVKRWMLAHEAVTKTRPVIPARAGIRLDESAGFRGEPGITKPK